ncbi:LEUCINE-RICH REPEAT-CONTAINING [Salix purpurea]|uniref:LEUCINE-RICH REPEAT-CONTAINING n=1 Tax=Salix purpurea TaxID=77065 RepID=A0A9Q0URQ8_SALPP|nr:LEUCINE-RICH REPEAT-CONTAINING [Salix purpurea]
MCLFFNLFCLKILRQRSRFKFQNFLCNTKKLRTLYSHLPVERKETVIDLLANLKYLRILILSESEFEGLPSSIGSLLHLRYLDLSMNLLRSLPKDTWKIATLRHLEITSKQEFLPKKWDRVLDFASFIVHSQVLSSFNSGSRNATLDCSSKINVLDLSGRLKRKDEDSLKGRRSLLSLIAGVNYRKEDKREQNEGGEKKEDGQHCLQKLRSLTFLQLPKLIELPYELKNAASSLRCLSISNCNNLSSLPDWLPQCTALKKLEIMKCRKLSSPPGSQDGKDYEVRYIMISPSQDLPDELKELVQKKTLHRANTVDLDVLTEERSNLNEF